MRNHLDMLGKVKIGFHAVQALFIFIAWALTIAVLTRDGGIGGSTWFYFTLCFITAPALIYQGMVPVYPRAERFANVYAYATIDLLFALLWLSAATAVAAWNTAGLNKGKVDDKDSDGSCNYFGYGDAIKCSISKATVGFGVLVFFLFVGTSVISIVCCRQYRQTCIVPGTKQRAGDVGRADDPSKDVWSSNIEERNPDEHEEVDDMYKYGQIPDEDGQQGLLHEPMSYIMQGASIPHPGSQLRYEQSTNSPQQGQRYDEYVPSSLSPGGHDIATAYHSQSMVPAQSHSANVQFPHARYDRV